MKEIKGILCALLTPLNEDESIDLDAAERLTEFVAAGGTNGILALGSTGESIALDREARNSFVKKVREYIPDEMPLLVGCGATSTKLAIRNCKDAQALGADGVIVTAPCFYPFGEDALSKYYEEVADAVDIPVYLYNISRFVRTTLTTSLVKRLSQDSRIKGIKESDRNEELVQQLIAVTAHREDFAVIQGSDRIFLKSFDWGCKAGVTVVGNVAPELPVRLYRAWADGRREEAQALQENLLHYVQAITCLGRYPQEMKAILAGRGMMKDIMTSPFVPLTDGEKKTVMAAWNELITI